MFISMPNLSCMISGVGTGRNVIISGVASHLAQCWYFTVLLQTDLR